MKISKFQLAVRGAAAVAIALAGSFCAVPALAEEGAYPTTAAPSPSATDAATPAPVAATPAVSDPAPAPTASTAPAAPAPVVSDAGLAEAIRRDLGMTLEEFNAAGEQAKRAADAVPSLRSLPGYVGISLRDGKIVVTGSGAELQARVDELNQAGPSADFVLVAPAAAAPVKVPSAADPAAVPVAAELVASSTEQLFQAYVSEVGPAGLQAVAYAGGHFIIRTGGINAPEAGLPAVLDPNTTNPVPAPGKISPADFVSRYANVKLEKGAPAVTQEDFFGGQGYVTGDSFICSAGFGAFSSTGSPEILTAGHCAGDGPTKKTAEIEDPSGSQAATGILRAGARTGLLGTFGFSQFGGPNNSWITGDPNITSSIGNVGTDIAVIGGIRPDLALQPAVTKWRGDAPTFSNADPTNPGPTAVKIIGMGSPFQGQSVCRSGRTEGWSCGSIDEIGIYVVGGSANPQDLRAFKGFLSNSVQSSGGDSGGPWISGNYAVGTHSAGNPNGSLVNFAVATTLEDSITHIPGGVQLQLFLNNPELVAPANGTFTARTPITGRVLAAPASAVAANSKVRITVAGQQPVDLPVDASGNWSFTTPSSTGRFQFTAETVNGFSRSGVSSLSINVSDLVVPVISKPVEGAGLNSVDAIDGTGTPGSTVMLSGDATGSGVVSPDGHWSIKVAGQPVYGKVSITAVQTEPGHEDSPSATQNFTVVPPAPAETTIPDGLHFSQDALPSTISGSGVDGAEVTVLIDGMPTGVAQTGGGAGVGARSVVRALVPQVLVAGGRWSVPFPSGLAVGAHTLSVTQSVDGVASAPVAATFTIDPAAVHPAAAMGSSGTLANTGAGALLPAAGLAAGALVLGGTLLLFGRRRAHR